MKGDLLIVPAQYSDEVRQKLDAVILNDFNDAKECIRELSHEREKKEFGKRYVEILVQSDRALDELKSRIQTVSSMKVLLLEQLGDLHQAIQDARDGHRKVAK